MHDRSPVPAPGLSERPGVRGTQAAALRRAATVPLPECHGCQLSRRSRVAPGAPDSARTRLAGPRGRGRGPRRLPESRGRAAHRLRGSEASRCDPVPGLISAARPGRPPGPGLRRGPGFSEPESLTRQ
eukprot:767377-Hanusia_phi.AAC.2